MIPVHQRVIEAGRGDCMAACIASILEMSLDAVPNPNDHAEGYHRGVEAFLRTQGMVAVKVLRPLEPTEHGLPLDYYNAVGLWCIASVPSQRFPGKHHAVVAQVQRPATGGFRIALMHDPNPGNVPYPDDIEIAALTFLCPLNYPMARRHA